MAPFRRSRLTFIYAKQIEVLLALGVLTLVAVAVYNGHGIERYFRYYDTIHDQIVKELAAFAIMLIFYLLVFVAHIFALGLIVTTGEWIYRRWQERSNPRGE